MHLPGEASGHQCIVKYSFAHEERKHREVRRLVQGPHERVLALRHGDTVWWGKEDSVWPSVTPKPGWEKNPLPVILLFHSKKK